MTEEAEDLVGVLRATLRELRLDDTLVLLRPLNPGGQSTLLKEIQNKEVAFEIEIGSNRWRVSYMHVPSRKRLHRSGTKVAEMRQLVLLLCSPVPYVPEIDDSGSLSEKERIELMSRMFRNDEEGKRDQR